MKDFNEKLKRVLKEKKVSQKTLSQKIEMSEAGFSNMISSNSIKVETLEKICEVLEIPITYFLEIDAENKTKYVGFWKQLYEEASDEAKRWKIRAYELEEQFGVSPNFKVVSERRGVQSPIFLGQNSLTFSLTN